MFRNSYKTDVENQIKEMLEDDITMLEDGHILAVHFRTNLGCP